MWLLFHHSAKTKPVEGGRSFVEQCPECGRNARFEEVEVSDSFGVFFVDLIDDKERKYRCSACRETFDLKADPAADRAPPTAPARSARQIAAERAALEARRAAEAAQRRADAEIAANRIEDELAELKKRMGR
jgi:transposase-like protein